VHYLNTKQVCIVQLGPLCVCFACMVLRFVGHFYPAKTLLFVVYTSAFEGSEGIISNPENFSTVCLPRPFAASETHYTTVTRTDTLLDKQHQMAQPHGH
jgi:hypothetical protein